MGKGGLKALWVDSISSQKTSLAWWTFSWSQIKFLREKKKKKTSLAWLRKSDHCGLVKWPDLQCHLVPMCLLQTHPTGQWVQFSEEAGYDLEIYPQKFFLQILTVVVASIKLPALCVFSVLWGLFPQLLKPIRWHRPCYPGDSWLGQGLICNPL